MVHRVKACIDLIPKVGEGAARQVNKEEKVGLVWNQLESKKQKGFGRSEEQQTVWKGSTRDDLQEEIGHDPGCDWKWDLMTMEAHVTEVGSEKGGGRENGKSVGRLW